MTYRPNAARRGEVVPHEDAMRMLRDGETLSDRPSVLTRAKVENIREYFSEHQRAGQTVPHAEIRALCDAWLADDDYANEECACGHARYCHMPNCADCLYSGETPCHAFRQAGFPPVRDGETREKCGYRWTINNGEEHHCGLDKGHGGMDHRCGQCPETIATARAECAASTPPLKPGG